MEDTHPRRLRPRIIHGFLPLPPISASPVCTPTSTSSRAFSLGDDYTTAPTTPSSDCHSIPPPTSPTPPPQPVRRSVTCAAKRPSSVESSESFSASFSPRPRIKRRASVPDLKTRKPEAIFHISHLISEENGDIRLKDDTRRYHALLELLSTELSYVRDLRALATVYLPNLATITSRTPLSSRTSSFSSLSHLQMTYIAQSSKDKEKERSPLFTTDELDLLTRNVTEIYQFHDKFVEELGDALGPLGFHFSQDFLPLESTDFDNVDPAITITSAKFATEASRFSSYGTFCARHSEAMDVVRRITHQYPSEWDSYENFCSSQIEDTHTSSPVSTRSLSQESTDNPGTVQARKRTSSLDSLRKNRRTKSKELALDLKQDKQKRLSLIDYLIKPIQRICKYPLLLDQLAIRKGTGVHNRSSVNVVVESAALAMKHVASLVDEARHRQEVSLQSSLIISRISSSKQIPSRFQYTSELTSQPQVLTPSFLSSLGTCLLAGSLDVLHNQAYNAVSTSAVAKYMGAFLYPGGYLILVKVRGKLYESRHWFRLVDFDLVDLEQNLAMLPFSFSLSCPGHDFEFAASCQREKMVWIAAIRESLQHPNTSWTNEPLSSLQVDGKGDLIPSAIEGSFETINALPTIYSIPDLKSSSPELTHTLPDAFSAYAPTPQYDPAPSRFSSRRSSMASIFTSASDADTILIRRSTAAARSQVDLGLEDVLSAQCVTARSYATSREEPLFQAPHVPCTSVSKSSGGLSSHLRKHESLRVPRRKKHNSMDDATDLKLTIGVKSLVTRTRHKHLSTASATFEDVSPSFLALDASQTSATALSNSPTHESAIKSTTRTDTSRSHPTSLYDNVRGLFTSHSVTPSTCREPTPHWHTNQLRSRSFLKRWVSTSRHRHTRSAPDQITDNLTAVRKSEKEDSRLTSTTL